MDAGGVAGVEALLAGALSQQPSGAVLEQLAALEAASLTPAQRLDLVTAFERHRRWLEALSFASLAAIDVTGCEEVFAFTDGRGCPGGIRCKHDWSGDDVGLALQISPFAGINRVRRARHLMSSLPELVNGLSAGDVSGMHAAMTAEATSSFEQDRIEAIWHRIGTKTMSSTPGQFRSLLAKAVAATTDPATVLADHAKAAREQTGIKFKPLDDGLTMASVIGPADQMHGFATWADAAGSALSPVASETVGAGTAPTQTRGQRQVAALLADLLGRSPASIPMSGEPVLAGATGSPASPGRSTRRPVALNLTMSLSTWLGLSGEPGDLAGHGPLPAELARSWAALPESVRVVIFNADDGPGGASIEAVGSRRRFPTAAQRDLVIWRDGTCCWPGCPRPAEDCDLDHIVAFSEGGETSTCNLQPLCPRHHAMKHATGWSPVRQADGTTRWARAGRRAVVRTAPDAPTDLLLADAGYNDPYTWLPESLLASFAEIDPPDVDDWTPTFEPDDLDPPPD